MDDYKERIIKKAVDCLKQFIIGPFPLIREELIPYMEEDNVRKATALPFFSRHKKEIVAFSMVVDMLRGETNYWTSDFDEGRIKRRIGEKLTSVAKFFVPGLDTDFLNALSSEKYEGASAKNAAILLLPSADEFRKHSNCIEFSPHNQLSFQYENKHAIRKQMNMGNASMVLAAVFQKEDYSTIYKTVGLAPVNLLSLFCSVEFPAHMHWKLRYPGVRILDKEAVKKTQGEAKLSDYLRELDCLVQYVEGSMKFPTLDLTDEYAEEIGEIFTGSDPNALGRLITSTCKQASKGTALIISDEDTISNEATTLVQKYCRGTCFPSGKTRLLEAGNDTLKSFSSIDGAVLVDTKCQCHAFGVILDGKVERNAMSAGALCGDSSRGAKYNCTKTYIKTLKKPAIGVVISEDGMIDLIDNRDVLRMV